MIMMMLIVIFISLIWMTITRFVIMLMINDNINR